MPYMPSFLLLILMIKEQRQKHKDARIGGAAWRQGEHHGLEG